MENSQAETPALLGQGHTSSYLWATLDFPGGQPGISPSQISASKPYLKLVGRGLLRPERTGNTGEGVVGVAPDQTHSADHQYQDDGEHDGIFSDILSLIVFANIVKYREHTFHNAPSKKYCSKATFILAAVKEQVTGGQRRTWLRPPAAWSGRLFVASR